MNDLNQGPCLDAVRTHRTIRVHDLATETRWPLFSTGAAELGARSGVLSIQLFVTADTLGAPNLYSSRPAAFTDES